MKPLEHPPKAGPAQEKDYWEIEIDAPWQAHDIGSIISDSKEPLSGSDMNERLGNCSRALFAFLVSKIAQSYRMFRNLLNRIGNCIYKEMLKENLAGHRKHSALRVTPLALRPVVPRYRAHSNQHPPIPLGPYRRCGNSLLEAPDGVVWVWGFGAPRAR
jgi:hypothetical protein